MMSPPLRGVLWASHLHLFLLDPCLIYIVSNTVRWRDKAPLRVAAEWHLLRMRRSPGSKSGAEVGSEKPEKEIEYK